MSLKIGRITYTVITIYQGLNIMGNYVGTSLDDHLVGTSENDTLIGLAGNDTLDGGLGDDVLDGGEGDDTVAAYNLASDGMDMMDLGTGMDTLNVSATGASQIRVMFTSAEVGNNNVNDAGSLANQDGMLAVRIQAEDGTGALTGNMGRADDEGVEIVAGAGTTLDIRDLVSGVARGDQFNVATLGSNVADMIDESMSSSNYYVNAGQGDDMVMGGSGNDFLVGGAGADMLTGNMGNDSFIGGGGNDSVMGGAGNDVLDGGLDADILNGGAGNDLYYVDNVGDNVVNEEVTGGLDSIFSSVNYSLDGRFVENLTLTGTNAITATGNMLNNVLTGNSGNNTLSGGSGNDTLDGGVGADVLDGGTGDDTYHVDNIGDNVINELQTGGGIDTIISSVNYSLSGRYVENLTLTGTSNVTATGNSLNNVLTGNSGNNTLSGSTGNDTLDGGLGADVLDGGTGNDTYYVDNVGDNVANEQVTGGTDTIFSSVGYSLNNRHVENLTLIGTGNVNAAGNNLNNVLTGNSGNNILYGGTGNDTLDGGLGADTLRGSAGNDTYYVDNVGDAIEHELVTDGIDTIFSSLTYSLNNLYIENLTLIGANNLQATGNSSNNVLIGNSGNNSLIGAAGDDTLSGGTGSDTLDGGLGADVLDGGAGDDTYYVDNVGDNVINEQSTGGLDSIFSTVSYSINNRSVENLTLTGTDNVTATGNGLNNVLTGNSGNNTLSGGTGNDTLDGGLGADILSGGEGNDLYYVDNVADDVINESVTGGTDTILSSVYYSLHNRYVENLTLIGTGNVNAAGNNLNNVLTGNSGNNTLSGGTGNDTYVFGIGGGQDLITEISGTADVLSILSGVTEEQLWFKKVGNNLEVSIVGTTDKVAVNNWYVGGTVNQVEQIRTATGDVLASSQVQNLVAAMSSFSPPPVGTTTLDSGTYASVLSVIAANWS